MKALVLKAYRQFAVEDVPSPERHPDEVLIKVRACGICGSDVHGMDGITGRRIPPIIMGHEAAGEVVEAGYAASGWKPGERVTFDSTIYCGSCWHCLRGQVNLCDHRQVIGVSCAEYRRDGAFAEFIAVPARCLYRLPDATTFEQAALAEAVSVAVHAAGRTPLSPHSRVAVMGAGMIGLLLIQVLKAKGCTQILAIDLDESRLARAAGYGATATVQSKSTDVAAAMRDLTDGRGVDVTFEVVGLEETVTTAVDCTRKGGSIVLIGNVSPVVTLPLQIAVTREISLIGSCASSGEYPAALDLIAHGKVDVSGCVSAEAPLERGAHWFERLRAGEKGLMKVLLKP